MRKLSNKWLSHQNVTKQTLGALCKSNWILGIFIFALLLIAVGLYFHCADDVESMDGLAAVGVTLLFGCVCFVVPKLNYIFSLRRQEIHITWTQIVFLVSFGIWIATMVSLIGITHMPNGNIIIAIGGSVLSWIFQDTIKSVAAFFYLRANGLLRIGDWIQVPARQIDGVVKTISLTTVTIENWDTTTSAFPIYILHSEHFKNNQKMWTGKTYGRQMLKTFTLDTGWIHPLSEEDCERLKKNLNIDSSFKDKFLKSKKLNAEVFRLYIYYWLMNHPHVSQEPRLIVRWLQQTQEGMPLQIYAYIIDCTLAPFEWQQSQIIEHFLKALSWFDLQLFQTPSGYDTSNSNINMVENRADYRKYQNDYATLS